MTTAILATGRGLRPGRRLIERGLAAWTVRLSEGGRNLSAGEARRVLLTRAALSGSRLLLLDEPDDALDVDGPALVEHLVRQSDATTLIITHNLALARRMDALWFVEDGRVVEAGPPAELLAGAGPTAKFFAPRRAA